MKFAFEMGSGVMIYTQTCIQKLMRWDSRTHKQYDIISVFLFFFKISKVGLKCNGDTASSDLKFASLK
jgi:hypothetical protein